MYNGIINIYKEKEYTSFDVVAKLRGILKMKKIGHTGTLDPDACGVLPVCLGSATKLCDMLTEKKKEYRVTMLLGKTTTTLDISGEVINETELEKVCSLDETHIKETIMSFLGEINQIPPMYSAIKINGQRLYQLARQGIEVEREPRRITIYNIFIEKIDLPHIEMLVSCSKGTYIRSLCDDIGRILGVGACMEELVRTKSGPYFIENSYTLDEVSKLAADQKLDSIIEPIDQILSNYSKVYVNPNADKKLHNGNSFNKEDIAKQSGNDTESVRVYDSEGIFTGLYQEEKGIYKNIKMFYEKNENNQ